MDFNQVVTCKKYWHVYNLSLRERERERETIKRETDCERKRKS